MFPWGGTLAPMKLAHHWSKQSAHADLRGERVEVSCWRGSAESLEDATRLAKAAAARLAERVAEAGTFGSRDGYGYGDRPLREEVLERRRDEAGAVSLAVTRNAMGARVLNAARAMFVDLDLGPLSLWQQFRALLRGSRATPEELALARVATWLAAHPGWGFRVYRTPRGLRLLATQGPQEPETDSTRRILEELGCDPLFIRLCRVQESFRARLDPKPFRVGIHEKPPGFPRESPEEAHRFEAWLQAYRHACEGCAACAFLAHLGDTRIHPDLAPVVRLHDEATLALHGGRRLA